MTGASRVFIIIWTMRKLKPGADTNVDVIGDTVTSCHLDLYTTLAMKQTKNDMTGHVAGSFSIGHSKRPKSSPKPDPRFPRMDIFCLNISISPSPVVFVQDYTVVPARLGILYTNRKHVHT